LKAKAFISGVYDDNINYGDDDNFIPGFQSKETAGLEGGIDLYATYDIGTRENWLLIGGFDLFNSWYEAASEQEMASLRGYAGARRPGRNSVFEIVGRAERLWYGHAALVDVFGSDMAFMQRLSSQDWLITSATLEQREYDAEFDPAGNRDAVYARLGETWKHFFSTPNTYIGLGGDLLLEDANNNINSYLGYRIRLDGQMELPGSLLGYAGGRYRRLTYDDPDFGFMNEQEDDRWDVFIGAKRKLTDQLTMDLQYLHIQNDSNMALNDYNRNRLNLTATYEF
jgi:opacity protein-like surface antigen